MCPYICASSSPLSLSLSLSPSLSYGWQKNIREPGGRFFPSKWPNSPRKYALCFRYRFYPRFNISCGICMAREVTSARNSRVISAALFPIPPPPSLPPSLSLSLSLARGMESRSAISTRNGKTPAYKTISLFGELRSICADQQIISPSRYALAMYALLTVALERFRNGF
jgi:hypothetical protein